MAKKKVKVHESSKVIWVILAIVIIVLLVTYKYSQQPMMQQNTYAPVASMMMQQEKMFDLTNQTIMLNNEQLKFVNGSYKSTDGNHTASITNEATNPSKQNYAAIVEDSHGDAKTDYLVAATIKDKQGVYATPVALESKMYIVSVTVSDKSGENNGIITVKYLGPNANLNDASDPKQVTTKEFAFQDDGNVTEVLH